MGFRCGIYRTAQKFVGYYEKQEGFKQNPFAYGEDERMVINVLFENKENALKFRAKVYENVSIVSPEDLNIQLEVEPALGAELDETILIGHFRPDEDSPPETPRYLSVITELYDTSSLFQYQRLEDDRLFGVFYKADKAHLIDKPLCEKGQRFSKFQGNENNFLALSKEVHCWFDALTNVNEKIPFFNLEIKEVSTNSDPENGFRYRVLLYVNAYNVETARLLFPRLKNGSTRINDIKCETFVYVLNPEEFRVCLEWKANKINNIWNFTPAID